MTKKSKNESYHTLQLLSLLEYALRQHRGGKHTEGGYLQRKYLLALDKDLGISPANTKGEHVYLYNKLLREIRVAIRTGEQVMTRERDRINLLLKFLGHDSMADFIVKKEIVSEYSASLLYPAEDEALANSICQELKKLNRSVFYYGLGYSLDDWAYTAELSAHAQQITQSAVVLILLTPNSLHPGQKQHRYRSMRKFWYRVLKQEQPIIPLAVGWLPHELKPSIDWSPLHGESFNEQLLRKVRDVLPQNPTPIAQPTTSISQLISSLNEPEFCAAICYREDLDEEELPADTGELLLKPKELQFRSLDAQVYINSRPKGVLIQEVEDSQGQVWVQVCYQNEDSKQYAYFSEWPNTIERGRPSSKEVAYRTKECLFNTIAEYL